MYKVYKVYTGRRAYDNNEENIADVLAGINERNEIIVSVTGIAEGYYVLIITKESQ